MGFCWLRIITQGEVSKDVMRGRIETRKRAVLHVRGARTGNSDKAVRSTNFALPYGVRFLVALLTAQYLTSTKRSVA